MLRFEMGRYAQYVLADEELTYKQFESHWVSGLPDAPYPNALAPAMKNAPAE